MGQLVLLVVAAAWAAVLVPPLLRSRIENRPNSSVSDFRNQLSSLQRAVPARGASMRSMARPLAPSPLSRPAATGRPGSPMRAHGASQARLSGPADRRRRPEPVRVAEVPRVRSHAEHRARRPAPGRDEVKRRRANVLFVLALTAASAAFLAATTKTQAMVWVAVVAFAALLGYVCLLGQLRQRELAPAPVQATPARRAPRQEERRHGPRSSSAHRQPASRRAADRWSHAV